MTSLFEIAGNQLENMFANYGMELKTASEQTATAITNSKNDNYISEPTSTSVVETLSYLLGVNKTIFEKEEHPFRIETFNKLHENKDARTIRILCVFRIMLMRNYDRINSLMRFELKNLESMGEFFAPEDLAFLAANNIHLQKPNYHPQRYIIDINRHISENISSCKDLFPLLKFDYIKTLFLMPDGAFGEGVKKATNVYTANAYDYPYSVYLNWTDKQSLERNLLFNDRLFLQSLYSMNKDTFTEVNKLRDAKVATKMSIYEYLLENTDSVMIVDCENSDAFKLYSIFKTLTVDELKKIKKLVLIDDIHTTTAWQMLTELTPSNITVEYIPVERINARKSLVDIRVTTKICEEYYMNKVTSFLVCSSDSDFWGVVEALPDVNFLFMIEDTKCGTDIQRAFQEGGITWCSMDEFADKSNDFKVQALKMQMKAYIEERLNINIKEMEEVIFTDTRITLSEGEKTQFRNNYIRTLKFAISESGDVEVVIKEK